MSWETIDNTYDKLRSDSLDEWLSQMEQHEDVAVRGGVKLAKDYIQHLKDENARLREEGELKNEFLRKMKAKNM